MKNNYKKSQQGGGSKAIPNLRQGFWDAIQVHSPLIVIMSTISITIITLRWLWGGIAMIGGIFSLLLWYIFGKTPRPLTNNFGFASNPDLMPGMEGLIYLFPAFMVGYVPASAMEIIDEDNNASSTSVIARAIFGGVFYALLLYGGFRYYKSFIKSSGGVYLAMGISAVVGGAIGIMAHSMIGDELYDAFYFSRGDGQSGKCYIKEVSI